MAAHAGEHGPVHRHVAGDDGSHRFAVDAAAFAEQTLAKGQRLLGRRSPPLTASPVSLALARGGADMPRARISVTPNT
jgi:hypothetical protein